MSQANTPTRIPSLDGLRAISILLVLHGHLLATRNYLRPEPQLWLGDTGNLGVRVFFVISGFLITTLLLQERANTGRIDIKQFYLRRAFRIFPAFYAYVAALLVASITGSWNVPTRDLIHASTYTINFVSDRSWQVGHLWSLAVEEQFYLLWPALLLLFGMHSGLFIAGLVMLTTPLMRLGWAYLFPQQQALIGEAFPTVCDTIAAGCLLALAREKLHALPRYRAVLEWRGFFLVPLVGFAINAQLPHWTKLHWLVGESCVNLAIAVTLDWCMRNPSGTVGSWLNARPVAYLGTLSYSIYLWQQPFLNRHSTAWYCAFPQNLALVAVLAVLSYYLVERPFLALRKRMTWTSRSVVALLAVALAASMWGCRSSAPSSSAFAPPSSAPNQSVSTGSNPVPAGDPSRVPDDPFRGAPPQPALSNPVTTARSGSGTLYEVGPGKKYAEPDTVPWGSLEAGDVVNIYHRPEPYRFKLCLRGEGTAEAPIVINGVTDAQGNRPRFDFSGARTASGCNPGGGDDVFDTQSEWSLEDFAGIVVRAGVRDPWGYKPRFIEIRNLELYGATSGNPFTNLQGKPAKYRGGTAIWLQPSADVLIENCVIYDNTQGVFVMAKGDELGQACERVTLRNNRIYGNGEVGSFLFHNVYMQSTNPVVEGNYIGVLRKGSEGSSYKSRSSGEVFRYNYVEASARAVDLVQAEEQTPGVGTQPDYGVDQFYGNVIVNDCGLTRCAGVPLHFGGDNLGRQENDTQLFVPKRAYRRHLYFYNNTVFSRASAEQMYNVVFFDLSERSTRVDAWNNIFYAGGSAHYSWLLFSGQLNLMGTNVVQGNVAAAAERSLPENYSLVVSGQLLQVDPGFVAPDKFDFRPTWNSLPAAPRGETPASTAAGGPAQPSVILSPQLRQNGMQPRNEATSGGPTLGALAPAPHSASDR